MQTDKTHREGDSEIQASWESLCFYSSRFIWCLDVWRSVKLIHGPPHQTGNSTSLWAGFVLFKQGRLFSRATRWKRTINQQCSVYLDYLSEANRQWRKRTKNKCSWRTDVIFNIYLIYGTRKRTQKISQSSAVKHTSIFGSLKDEQVIVLCSIAGPLPRSGTPPSLQWCAFHTSIKIISWLSSKLPAF